MEDEMNGRQLQLVLDLVDDLPAESIRQLIMGIESSIGHGVFEVDSVAAVIASPQGRGKAQEFLLLWHAENGDQGAPELATALHVAMAARSRYKEQVLIETIW
jgi:hypothetical protein